jgi:polysaccharide pyruvyl transferase WcaK-like protein
VGNVAVFSRASDDTPPLAYSNLPYGPIRNLLHDRAGWEAIKNADTVLWTVGLDIQDDSSLIKLIYLWVNFQIYRLMGKQVWVLFQGAGPLGTRSGISLAKAVLGKVDLFVARDPGTYNLVGRLKPDLNRLLANDAIFFPGFEADTDSSDQETSDWLNRLFEPTSRPVISVNLRQWFHFASSLLPYQLSRRTYLERSRQKMLEVVGAMAQIVNALRRQMEARVLLVSAYQPGVVPWEDDIGWLQQVKDRFTGDNEVILIDRPLSIPAYFELMSRIHLMIGMRLHSSLIALRFGVPSINLSYTLKGNDILQYMGLAKNAFPLEQFLVSPEPVLERSMKILENWENERKLVQSAVEKAIADNMGVLRSVLSLPPMGNSPPAYIN